MVDIELKELYLTIMIFTFILGDAIFEESLAYIKKHNLYKYALKLYDGKGQYFEVKFLLLCNIIVILNYYR